MSSRDFLAWRLEGDSLSEVPERVVEEGPLSLRVNGKTPEDLLALYEESVGADGASFWEASIKRRPALEAKLGNRSLASTSSCGFCGKTEWTGEGDSSCATGDVRDALKVGSAFLEACFR
jgi:formate dehydrogenase assembly factor FdhD